MTTAIVGKIAATPRAPDLPHLLRSSERPTNHMCPSCRTPRPPAATRHRSTPRDHRSHPGKPHLRRQSRIARRARCSTFRDLNTVDGGVASESLVNSKSERDEMRLRPGLNRHRFYFVLFSTTDQFGFTNWSKHTLQTLALGKSLFGNLSHPRGVSASSLED